MKNTEVSFTYKKTDYHIFIDDVRIYPQGYAAIASFATTLKGINLIADIGNGTMNTLYMINGKPQQGKMFTEKFGTYQCTLAVREAFMRKIQREINDAIIDEVLITGTANIAPALIYAIDRDSAAIAVVDSNLHREHILPSEKAFAYKLKADVLKHQGQRTDITSVQVAPKLSTELIGAQERISKDTVKRYIRLTYLIPEFLEKMDNGEIALSVGVELSFLSKQSQREVLEQCAVNDCTPSYSQAWRMHKEDRAGKLDSYAIMSIMSEEKANQVERLKIPMERIRKYFPQSYTVAQIEDAVVKLCERDYRRRNDRER